MPDGASAMIGKVAGKPPEEMTGAEYLGTLKVLGWDQPTVEEMQGYPSRCWLLTRKPAR